MTLLLTNPKLAIASITRAFNTPKTKGCASVQTRALPLAKHAGFTNGLVMIFVDFAMRRWKYYHGRSTVRTMLNLDNSALMDLNLTRGDLLYVLQTPSAIDPTTRLRLLSIERRNLNKNDQQRRASYISGLIPMPFNGSLNDKRAPDKTAA